MLHRKPPEAIPAAFFMLERAGTGTACVRPAIAANLRTLPCRQCRAALMPRERSRWQGEKQGRHNQSYVWMSFTRAAG
jgi:hypothetical protein